MDVKSKPGVTKVKRNKTEKQHFGNVYAMCRMVEKNCNGDLGKLAADAAVAVNKLTEALDKHEAEK